METDLTKAWRSGNIQALERLGCTISPSKEPGGEINVKLPKKEMVQPGICVLSTGKVIILIAAETKNETNQRDWKAKNRRAGSQWQATRKAIGPHLGLLATLAQHLAQGGAVKATFTRMGGRHLDQLANLGAAFKGVEDAICFLLGIDDDLIAWHPVPMQEPGSGPVGIRVELEEYR